MDPVVHFEIPAEDYERAKKFYAELFGWKIEEWPGGNMKYGMAMTTPTTKDGKADRQFAINGAIMDKGNGVNSTVITIEVPSIDEHLKKITRAGGKLKMAKMKVGDMGYNATFYDPEGNIVGLWENVRK